VLLHLCIAAVIAIALQRAVTNKPIIPAGPFTPIHLSDAVLFPSHRAGTGGDTTAVAVASLCWLARGYPARGRASSHDAHDACAGRTSSAGVTAGDLQFGHTGHLAWSDRGPRGVRGPASDGPETVKESAPVLGDGIGQAVTAAIRHLRPDSAESACQE